MEKDTVNLYASPTCPKCKILKSICEKSRYIKEDTDFEIFDVTSCDTAMDLLYEKGISTLPVLLVNNDFFVFSDAVKYIRGRDKQKSEVCPASVL